jgi:hypothetical protein
VAHGVVDVEPLDLRDEYSQRETSNRGVRRSWCRAGATRR